MTPPRILWDRRTLILYALPGLALAMPTIPVFVFLPTLYADTLGLGLAAVGAVLLAARLIDGITDPLVGLLSDRLHTRWGRRKPWIALGGLLAGPALVMLFMPPDDAGIGHLLLWSIVLYVGWTLISVPYTAWGAELSGDYNERARITGWREGLMVVGILVAGAMPVLATTLGLGEAVGLGMVAGAAVVLGLPAIVLLLARVPEVPVPPVPASPRRDLGTFWQQAKGVLRNRPFVRLLAAWVLNGMAGGLPAVLFPLYLEHGLGVDEATRDRLILIYFVAAVVAIPGWLALSRAWSKHRAWAAAMALACASFVWVPFLGPGDVWPFLVVCVLTGAALGADLALPPAMQADVIDLDALRTGQRREGMFFALWGMGTKGALALAVGFAFPVLDAVGFDAGAEANTPMALATLVGLYALAPVALKLGVLALVWNHPMTQRRQAIIRKRLNRQKKTDP